MAADSGPSRDQGPVVTRAGQKLACYPVTMNFGKLFSPSHSFPLLDLSCSTAIGRFWVLPQVSVLTPPRENVV